MKCVECGVNISKLFEEPLKGNITLVTCENCGKIADKYIEYEYTLILLNLILCKTQVYRHILFNINFCSTTKDISKLFLASCVLDMILCSCVDIECWVIEFLRCIAKNSIYHVIIIICASLVGISFNKQSLIRAILVASFGKLGSLMIVTWKYSFFHRYMMQFFIYVNCIVSVRECLETSNFRAFSFILIALIFSSIENY